MVSAIGLFEDDCGLAICADLLNCVVGCKIFDTAVIAFFQALLLEFHLSVSPLLDSVLHMSFYSTDRIQERFKGKAPAEVRAEALAADSPAQYPIPVNKRIQKYKARYAA